MTWDPVRLAGILSCSGIPAIVDDSSVQIRILENDRPSMLGRLLQRNGKTVPVVITIQHDPKRFIRNIDVLFDPMQYEGLFLRDISAALRECGCIIDSDRNVAANYCPVTGELLSLLDRLDEFQRQKKECVVNQDFESARMKRDSERSVRDTIDSYLFCLMDR